MTSQVLNGFRIDLCVDQVCDVSMVELMRRNLEVHTVCDLAIMRSDLAKNRRYSMLDFLVVNVSYEVFLIA